MDDGIDGELKVSMRTYYTLCGPYFIQSLFPQAVAQPGRVTWLPPGGVHSMPLLTEIMFRTTGPTLVELAFCFGWWNYPGTVLDSRFRGRSNILRRSRISRGSPVSWCRIRPTRLIRWGDLWRECFGY